MIVDFIFVFIALISALFCAIKHRLSFWAYHSAPAAKPLFSVGDLGENGRKMHVCELTKRHYDEHKTRGPFCGSYIFLSPAAIITDLDLVDRVLYKDSNQFRDQGIFYHKQNDPLLFLPSATAHEKCASLFHTTFADGNMEEMFNSLLDVADQLKCLLNHMIEAHECDVDVKNVFGQYAIDAISMSALGIECNVLHHEIQRFDKTEHFEFRWTRATPIQSLIMRFRAITRMLGLKKLPLETMVFYENIIRTATKYRENSEALRKDYLKILLHFRKHTQKDDDDDVNAVSHSELAAHVFLFYLAGIETSSTLQTYCTYELAKNQNIQERARLEIRNTLESYNGQLTYEALEKMEYVSQVLNGTYVKFVDCLHNIIISKPSYTETLRKYPPIPILTRITDDDYHVPKTDLVIPRKTTLIVPVYAIHRDANIYEEPDRFDPDRFSKEKRHLRHPMSFIPFGSGSQYCLGDQLGMMMSKLAIVTVLMNFKVSLNEEMSGSFHWMKKHTFLSNQGGVWLHFSKTKN